MALVVGDLVFQNVGAITAVAALSVDSTGAVSYSITAGKQGVSFQNVGSKPAWYGGSTVDPASSLGNKLFPNQSLTYKNVKTDFVIYFKCAAAETTTIAIVEHA